MNFSFEHPLDFSFPRFFFHNFNSLGLSAIEKSNFTLTTQYLKIWIFFFTRSSFHFQLLRVFQEKKKNTIEHCDLFSTTKCKRCDKEQKEWRATLFLARNHALRLHFGKRRRYRSKNQRNNSNIFRYFPWIDELRNV
jgi:hypothetical protein